MSVRLMSLIYDAYFGEMSYQTDDKTFNITGPTLKSIALALADHANDDGKGAYPSVTRLERKTEFSRPTIINALSAMRQNGVISCAGLSDRGTNDYSFNINKITEMGKKEAGKATLPGGEVVKPLYQGSKATLPGVVKPLDRGSKVALPESSINHPSNHPLNKDAAVENQTAAPQSVSRKKGDGVDMFLSGVKKPGEVDLSRFPEDVVPLLAIFLENFPLNVPVKPSKGSGAFGQWIGESRAIMLEMREFGGCAYEIIGEACVECKGLTITHPGALLNNVRSIIGKRRLAVKSSTTAEEKGHAGHYERGLWVPDPTPEQLKFKKWREERKSTTAQHPLAS